MDDFYYFIQGNNNDSFIQRSLPIIALSVSLIAVFFSVRIVYITKKLEIKLRQYDDLCLNPIQSNFASIDRIFSQSENDLVKSHLRLIQSTILDFQLYVSELSKIYRKIDTPELIKITEVFSDILYMNEKNKLSIHKTDYYQFKLSLYNKLYKYIITKEIRIIPFKWRLP